MHQLMASDRSRKAPAKIQVHVVRGYDDMLGPKSAQHGARWDTRLDDPVYIDRYGTGRIRSFGVLGPGRQKLYGIELDSSSTGPVGLSGVQVADLISNGTFDTNCLPNRKGFPFFQCDENRGILIDIAQSKVDRGPALPAPFMPTHMWKLAEGAILRQCGATGPDQMFDKEVFWRKSALEDLCSEARKRGREFAQMSDDDVSCAFASFVKVVMRWPIVNCKL